MAFVLPAAYKFYFRYGPAGGTHDVLDLGPKSVFGSPLIDHKVSFAVSSWWKLIGPVQQQRFPSPALVSDGSVAWPSRINLVYGLAWWGYQFQEEIYHDCRGNVFLKYKAEARTGQFVGQELYLFAGEEPTENDARVLQLVPGSWDKAHELMRFDVCSISGAPLCSVWANPRTSSVAHMVNKILLLYWYVQYGPYAGGFRLLCGNRMVTTGHFQMHLFEILSECHGSMGDLPKQPANRRLRGKQHVPKKKYRVQGKRPGPWKIVWCRIHWACPNYSVIITGMMDSMILD